MTIFLTVVVTVAVTLIALNFVTGEKKIDKRLRSLYAVSDPQFLRSMGSLLGPALRDGNRVTGLSNGDEIFPQMLAAIRSAQKTISLETYIYWSGSIGREFAEALSERARGSVKVHVLLDWVGSASMDGDMLKAMEASGVEVKKYHPLRWYNLARMNNRTHRKLLVVDGATGFTGGVGIADQCSATPRTKSTGETRTTVSRDLPWPSCRRPSWTTGGRHALGGHCESQLPSDAVAGWGAMKLGGIGIVL
jgi:cardiolipin synthase